MSYGGDEESGVGYDTARGRDWPSVRQFNVFLANRLGNLMHVVRRFETTDVRIISFTVVDSADCAIIRMVLSDPERAFEIFERAELPFTESDLLVVQLPDADQPLLQICKCLLAAEVSIHYAYPLLVGPQGSPALALHVEDTDMAAHHLQAQGFTLFSEHDLSADHYPHPRAASPGMSAAIPGDALTAPPPTPEKSHQKPTRLPGRVRPARHNSGVLRDATTWAEQDGPRLPTYDAYV